MNGCIREALGGLLPQFNIIHCCGRGNLAAPRQGYAQFEYADRELADLFALADAVVSRAGATALFELLALRKPGLLIPLPRSPPAVATRSSMPGHLPRAGSAWCCPRSR